MTSCLKYFPCSLHDAVCDPELYFHRFLGGFLHKFENYTGNEYQFTNCLLKEPDIGCCGNANAIQLCCNIYPFYFIYVI